MRKKLCLILVAVWGMALLAGCGGEAQNAARALGKPRFPAEAMAAVGGSAPVIGLLVNLFVGISLQRKYPGVTIASS